MWIVYLKEIRSLLRDRKTLVFAILIPIFAMPALGFGFAQLARVMEARARTQEIKYAFFGARNAPAVAALFARESGFRAVPLDGVEQIRGAIADDRIKLALNVPARFDDSLAASRQAALELHFNSADAGEITRRRVAAVIEKYNATLRERALADFGLTAPQLAFVLNPVKLDEHSTADQRERVGALIGGMLPYLLLIVCLMAAMYPAIDLGAGEKEGGTLETLLLAPIARSQLVMGKFMVLFSIGLAAALLMVSSLGVALRLFAGRLDADFAAVVLSLGVGDLALVALMLVPTAAIFASVLLAMSIYAKSYKEAAGMMQPMVMLTIMPLVLAMVPGVELNWVWASVPLTNIALAMKEIVKGTMDYQKFLMILLSSSVIAALLLAWCRRWFSREQVLFRD
ncbi:MAG: ABC transporter permease [Pseudomonadota bacterium]|nr:ABC transporter permease [Pseudomonadota bacterium]